jgi:hypothetical protein
MQAEFWYLGSAKPCQRSRVAPIVRADVVALPSRASAFALKAHGCQVEVDAARAGLTTTIGSAWPSHQDSLPSFPASLQIPPGNDPTPMK